MFIVMAHICLTPISMPLSIYSEYLDKEDMKDLTHTTCLTSSPLIYKDPVPWYKPPLAPAEKPAHRTNEKSFPSCFAFSSFFCQSQYFYPPSQIVQISTSFNTTSSLLKLKMRFSSLSYASLFAFALGPVSNANPISAAQNFTLTSTNVSSTLRNPFWSPFNTCCEYDQMRPAHDHLYTITLANDKAMSPTGCGHNLKHWLHLRGCTTYRWTCDYEDFDGEGTGAMITFNGFAPCTKGTVADVIRRASEEQDIRIKCKTSPCNGWACCPLYED